MESPHNPSLLLLSLSLLLFPLIAPSSACHPDDKEALLRIRAHFDYASPFATWNRHTDCCRWRNVRCSRGGRVTSLSIVGARDIAGEIPDEIGDLPYLTSLELSRLPNLTGPIPRCITRLTDLTSLSLSKNSLAGPIPGFLGDNTALEHLDLSSNSFTGELPPSLSSLTRLTELNLGANQLVGSIPETFVELENLAAVLLELNRFNGPVNFSLSNSKYLKFVDLSDNEFEGDASFMFYNKRIEKITLRRNLFEFDFSDVVIPKSLKTLDLSYNMIFGSLPEGLGHRFEYVDVSHNQLCGPIPNGRRLYRRSDRVRFEGNKCLCGFPLPPCDPKMSAWGSNGDGVADDKVMAW